MTGAKVFCIMRKSIKFLKPINGRPTDCTPTTKVTKQKLMSELLNTRSVT